MTKTGKISAYQMFSVMFLCRIISLFTFMLPSASYLPSGDRMITAFSVAVFEIIYAVLIFFTLRQGNNQGIIKATGELSPAAAKIISIVYCLCFLWFAGIGVARFELFLSTVMFPNSELYIMIILLLGASFYASLKGTEAIGRASSVLLIILGASIIFVIFSVMSEFEYTNLQPVLTKGILPIFSFSFYISVRTVELITLYITAPVINGNIKKMTISWICIFAAITTIILTVLTGVTGEYGNDQIFPLYTLTVIAKFGIFERLDDILTGIWVFCIFIQVSFLLEVSSISLKQGFGKIKKVPIGFICTIGIFIVYHITSQTVTVFSEIVSSKAMEILFILLAALIPLSVSLISFIKKRKHI